mmetsp:Transcript_7412/g.19761  ORF Transcript_7412/g.19761 Transcript_7412/m.19761 type:complete len:325 (-) Transcript_7412:75-1049(-)
MASSAKAERQDARARALERAAFARGEKPTRTACDRARSLRCTPTEGARGKRESGQKYHDEHRVKRGKNRGAQRLLKRIRPPAVVHPGTQHAPAQVKHAVQHRHVCVSLPKFDCQRAAHAKRRAAHPLAQQQLMSPHAHRDARLAGLCDSDASCNCGGGGCERNLLLRQKRVVRESGGGGAVVKRVGERGERLHNRLGRSLHKRVVFKQRVHQHEREWKTVQQMHIEIEPVNFRGALPRVDVKVHKCIVPGAHEKAEREHGARQHVQRARERAPRARPRQHELQHAQPHVRGDHHVCLHRQKHKLAPKHALRTVRPRRMEPQLRV